MEFNTVKALLKKISEFVNSLEKSGSKILPIEEELLKGYALELYRNIGHSDNSVIDAVIAKTTPTAPKVKIKPTPPAQDPPEAKKEEPVKEPLIVELEKKIAIPVKEKEVKKAEAKPEIQTQVKAPVIVKSNQPKDLNEMFSFEEAKDLAERLSQSPVTDLNSAMGINEKIFTINELFGGQATRFSKCVEKLHTMKNMNEAKNFLIQGIAKEENWAEASRIKKATNFVKLVRRLYP